MAVKNRKVTVKNLERLQHAFVLAGKDAPRFAATALREEADEAFLISQTVVPVRFGDLRASGAVTGPFISGSRALAYIRYGGPAVPYAVFVHELPPSRAYHDPPTRWKYLENPVRVYSEGMGDRMTTRVLDMVARRFEIG
jgi:hypothetical protein